METKTSDNCESSTRVRRKISLSYLKKSLVNRKKSPQLTSNNKTFCCDQNESSSCNCNNNRVGLLQSLRKQIRDNWNIFRSKQKIQVTNSNQYDSSVGWGGNDLEQQESCLTPTLPEIPPRLPEMDSNYADYRLVPSSTEENNSSQNSLDGDVITSCFLDYRGNLTQEGLTNKLFNLARWGWYWGPLSPHEAEDKLREQPEGTFLIRDSSADHYLLSVSFRSCGKTLHSRIEHNSGLFSFYDHEGFSSIEELISHSITSSQSSVFCYSRPRSPTQPAFPVRLTKPLSRFTQVKSLQYLCRFVIRQCTGLDNINKLPIPPTLQHYLLEAYF
ncbi:suppressor of cytokine signaling 6 [Chrysoperla carnea]|uniref:suppressor of cytokine signaling 6 n=1 Tax=Chrysoperla carnea TaxID=189513 RepID=UPI001D05DF30|nr:suppressor of cytokine signaling 6 [Chrysoperla carnea]